MKAIDLAYVAGIIDGEGCIAIDRFTKKENRSLVFYRLKLRISNTNKPLIDYLKFSFGGNIKYIKPIKTGQKEAWEWYIPGAGAADCLRKTFPYLKVKRMQAELGLKFQTAKRGRGHYKTDRERVIEKSQYDLARNLNKRGVEYAC